MPVVSNKEKQIITKLLRWYRKNKRNLPWRVLSKNNLPIPYYTMISEFMLQQTTVRTVISKFDEFIKIWPNLKRLNTTKEVHILKIWSGLGYYVRAKNLLKSINIIAKKHKYIIPHEYDDLLQLPGIGDYTAKAILGIAFNKPVMPVDVNIERIIIRIYGLSEPIPSIKKKIINCSTKLISTNRSSDLIQAFMDYGSLICLPNKPKCHECIISSYCIAFKDNLTQVIPLKRKKANKKPKKITRAYIIINQYKEVLVRRRPASGMLQSMLEVPNDKWVTNKVLLKKDETAKLCSIKFSKIIGGFIYSFSHFDLKVEIFSTSIKKRKIKNHSWIMLNKAAQSGMPTLMKKIIRI